MTTRARIIEGAYLMLVGVAFGVRGVIARADPDFWNAVTPLDYAAVWTHSLALVLVAPGLLYLARDGGTRPATFVVARVMAAGAVLSAFANGVEDGLHLKAFGIVYVVGALLFAYGMPVLAFLLARDGRAAYAIVPIVSIAGMLAYDAGGGILIGGAWLGYGLLVLAGRAGPLPATEPASRADAKAQPTSG